MRILVIGAGGFLGGHFTKRLTAQGHRVTAVSRRPVEDWYQAPEAACCIAGALHPETLQPVFDRVYHFAADVGGMPYQTKNRWPSVEAAQFDLAVIRYCANYGIELFYPSSVCVYGDLEHCAEQGKLRPTEGYGEAKLFAERAIRYAVDEKGLRAMVIRLDNTFGTHGDFFSDRAKAPMAFAGRAAKGAGLEVFAAPETSRGFMSVSQVVAAVESLASAGVWNGEPVNISCGEQTTLERLAGIAARGSAVSFRPQDTIGASQRVVDTALFRKLTGSTVLDAFDERAYQETCDFARRKVQ